MPKVIHARRRDGVFRFREWSSVVDAYTSDEMDRADMGAYLMRYYTPDEVERGGVPKEIDLRLNRAEKTGTSSYVDAPEDVDGPWETERCEGPNGCGGFHHAYAPNDHGTCQRCDEREPYRSHGDPCT